MWRVKLVNRWLKLLGIVAAFLVCGCSSFQRDWERAAKTPAAADSIEGRWEGRWSSEVNGHNGRLRCVLTPKHGNIYTASFRATYGKFLHYSYRVDFPFTEGDGAWQFAGAENLGWLAGGVYHYTGRVSPTNFHATYQSDYDHGTFEMSRP